MEGVTAARDNAAALPTPAAVLCPVCGAPSDVIAQERNWGTWQRCKQCTLEFVNPLRLPRAPTELFDDAYSGREDESGFHEFAHRVRQRNALIGSPELWFWTPAFTETLTWLERRVPQGGTVFEIACGLGFFLHSLRGHGFHAVGLDVADTVVELNRKDGFQVWHGTVDTVPEGWVEPQAIVAFFMLHHLEDPKLFLSTIRSKWPKSPLVLAQYGPSNTSEFCSMPPRNLTRWSARSLREVLERAGYRAEVRDIPSTGTERAALQSARGTIFEALIRVPPLYRIAKRVVDRVLPALLRPSRRDAYVLLAFAEPLPPTQ